MNKKAQKIILSGGAGLVGQSVVARLKSKGYTNIVTEGASQIMSMVQPRNWLRDMRRVFNIDCQIPASKLF